MGGDVAGQGCSSLDAIRSRLGDCHRCALGDARTTLVFGTGDPHARVMLVGEAPGKNEDLTGEPFVGAAGKFLDELLGHAGLLRTDVYIANVLKCRPPGNRDPQATEIETCTPFLREQIAVIEPEILVTLGNFATKLVLETDVGITQLHGHVQSAGPVTVLPVFHPAAAIYDRTKQDALFADFETLGELLGALKAEHCHVITTRSDEATRAVGGALAASAAAGDVVILSGDLGAGKTQLTKGLATALGVVEPITSPTFNLLLVHEGRLPLYHFDLYRLERAAQLDDIDYWGTLEADGVSVVEWGDRFAEAVPDECVVVRILITGDTERAITIESRGARGAVLAEAWVSACSAVPGAVVEGGGERA